jgi:hypothetical protein
MDETKTVNLNAGPAFLLTIVFVVLKLTNVIAWSWLWVLAPLWISFAIFLVVLGLVLLIALVVALFQ